MKPLMKYHCAIETTAGVVNTWGVYPILTGTKVLDGIYDPESKTLRLLFDSVKENLENVPVQKENGKYVYQQRRIDTYYKGHITDEDVSFFLDTYVDNNFEFKEKGLIITDEQS